MIECCSRILEVYPSKSETHCHKDLILSKQTTEYTLICRICKSIIKVPLNKPLKEFIVDESIKLLIETFLNNLNR